MGVSRFIEHRSERLNLLVRGADHPPAPLDGAVIPVEPGIYVSVLIHGGIAFQCGAVVTTPRANGMMVLAVREEIPWEARKQASHMRAVGVTMSRADLRERGMEPWFDSLFAGSSKLREIQVTADPRSIRLIETILSADLADPLDVLRVEAAAQDIFLRGVALLSGTGEPSRSDRLMYLAEMLEADLGHRWRLEEMARLAGMSARNLTERFGHEFGATPFEWLRQRRLLRARDLVIEESGSIASVADQLGFSSPAHFSTAFKAMFTQTPIEMRRSPARVVRRSSAAR